MVQNLLFITVIDAAGLPDSEPFFLQVYKKFCPDQAVPEGYRDRDFNVDLVPKFMMANGEIVRFLTHTGVTRYLEFKQISGSYVYKDGSIYRVPASEAEAISSSLLGIMEKRRVQKFFEFIQNWKEIDPSTHEGKCIRSALCPCVNDNY
jgi:Rab GDP dissociation inhibitor